MKKHPITSVVVTGALALAAVLTLHPTFGEDSGKIKRSGQMERTIDPSAPGFDMDRVEKSIRQNAKAMGIDAAQEAALDDALKQLREKVDSDKKQGKFNWRWEYSSDEAPPSASSKSKSRSNAGSAAAADDEAEDNSSKPAPRNNRRELFRQRQGGGLDNGRANDLLRQMLEEQEQNQGQGGNSGNVNPMKMLEEMLKRFGMDDQRNGGNGNPQFRFKFGPGQENGEQEDQGRGNRLEQMQRMFGQREHAYNPDTAPRDSKYSRFTLAEYRSTVKDARQSTVSVGRDGKQLSLGTIVTADGYILTKASEVGKGSVDCEFMDGKVLTAKIVSKLDNYDLALLKVDATNLKPVTWSETELAAGTMLAASGIDEDPISVGVVSVLGRNLDDSQKGFLGLGLAETAEGGGVGIRPEGVVPDGPAGKAGLQDGDTILAIDGQEVNHRQELMKLVASKSPGEIVKLRVKTADGEKTDISVTLGSRKDMNFAQGIDPTALMGTDLSGRPSGFPNVITNDLGINANQCGGPVVDIDGNVVGLNIARSGRTSTYMISAKNMKSFLADVQLGKLSIAKDPVSLDREVKKAEAALKAAQDALKAAQDAKEKLGK